MPRDYINIVNGLACLFWSCVLIVSVWRGKIPYQRRGTPPLGAVERHAAPRLFWALIAAMGVAAIWTGMAFFFPHR
jgi:hypothetical protein